MVAIQYAQNTIAHYESCVRRVLNYGYRKRKIRENPIREGVRPLKFGTRYITDDEWTRLRNAIESSPLKWLWLLLVTFPIRVEDALSRERGSFFPFGKNGPYLYFLAKKTANTRQVPKPAMFPLLWFPEILGYLNGMPDGQGYLFIRPDGSRWTYKQANNEWHRIIQEAGISDLHIHDLKAKATSDRLEQGFTLSDMVRLGWYSDYRMILRVYDRVPATDLMGKIEKRFDDRRGCVEVQKAVNE